MRVEWCDDLGTKATSDCVTLKRVLGQVHTHRVIDVPEPVTYEAAKAVAYPVRTCPTCQGAGVLSSDEAQA